jgi:uncharacterized protein
MFREYLDKDSGMLFVFDSSKYLSFHMKNTQIPLEIAFIDQDGIIVDIQPLTPFNTGKTISRQPAKYALEVNPGFFKRLNVKVGDRVDIKLPRQEKDLFL